MIKVGLTGGIATGKSTVASIFRRMGVPVIDSDAIAREVVEPGTEGYKRVVEAFGPEILDGNGRVDRRRLGALVFSSPDRRRLLESILHPLITERIHGELERHRRRGADVVVVEVPLLFEKGLDRQMDFTVVVYAPEDVQLKRLMERDGLSEEEARARIRSQMPVDEKAKLADYVIENTGSLKELEEQTRWVLEQVRRKTKR